MSSQGGRRLDDTHAHKHAFIQTRRQKTIRIEKKDAWMVGWQHPTIRPVSLTDGDKEWQGECSCNSQSNRMGHGADRVQSRVEHQHMHKHHIKSNLLYEYKLPGMLSSKCWMFVPSTWWWWWWCVCESAHPDMEQGSGEEACRLWLVATTVVCALKRIPLMHWLLTASPSKYFPFSMESACYLGFFMDCLWSKHPSSPVFGAVAMMKKHS